MILTRTSAVLLNEKQPSDAMTISSATIRRWRLHRDGPAFVKLGTSVRCRPEDIQRFIDGLPPAASQRITEYTIAARDGCQLEVNVHIGAREGIATGNSPPAVISTTVARAIGLEVGTDG